VEKSDYDTYSILLLQIRRTANFGNVGYVAMVTDSVGENFDVTFKMKTLSNNSLLLYARNNAKVCKMILL
jgi:hypothetical protein